MIQPDDIDVTAAEYVLGTLALNERNEVASLRSSIASLDVAIIAWENYLAPLNETTAEAHPSADVFPKIKRRILMQSETSVRFDPKILRRKVNYWRSLALAASVAFLLVSTALLHERQSSGIVPQPVALLQKDSTGPSFLVSLNEKTSTLTVHTITASPPADKSYELWVIVEGAKAPRSLGVLPTHDIKLVPLTINPAIMRNATLAVSIEPFGGSPTGAPTGPVIFTGKFVQAAL